MPDKLYEPAQPYRLTFGGHNEPEAVAAMVAYFQRNKLVAPADWQVVDKGWTVEVSVSMPVTTGKEGAR